MRTKFFTTLALLASIIIAVVNHSPALAQSPVAGDIAGQSCSGTYEVPGSTPRIYGGLNFRFYKNPAGTLMVHARTDQGMDAQNNHAIPERLTHRGDVEVKINGNVFEISTARTDRPGLFTTWRVMYQAGKLTGTNNRQVVLGTVTCKPT